MSKRPRDDEQGEGRPSKRGRGGVRGGGSDRGRGRGRGRGGGGGRGGGRGRGRGRGRGGRFFKPLSTEEIEKLKAASQLILPTDDFGAMDEASVGITFFSTQTKPFRGIIKQRYSDFMVHEIDSQGQVVHLTDTSLPKERHPMAHEAGIAELKTLVGEATAGNFNLWLAKELEKEELRKKAKAAKSKPQEKKGAALDAGEQPPSPARVPAPAAAAPASTGTGGSLADALSIPLEDEEAMSMSADTHASAFAPVTTPPPAPAAIAPPTEFLFDASLDKPVRTQLHQLIRRYWPAVATDMHDVAPKDTTSTAKREEHCVRARLKSAIKALQGKAARGDARALDEWPPDRPAYLKFALYKENKDTMEAVSQLARMTQLPQKLFSYAGTKDKRAITCQWVTAWKVPAEKIDRSVKAELARGYRHLRTGHYSYVPQPLKLGDLQGNRFTIVLRDVDADEKECISAVEALSGRGFVNYYGMQRFGTGGVPTHLIGKALLKQDWARAVALILVPRPHEQGDAKEGREYFWETRDPSGALAKLPPRMAIECAVLTGLEEAGPNGFYNALHRLPRNMRLMYLHAFQSYVWNHMATARVEMFGMDAPVPGDLVLASSASGSASGSGGGLDSDWLEDAGAQRVLSHAAAATAATEGDPEGKDATEEQEQEAPIETTVDSLKREMSARVHVVTQQDVDARKYTMADVVLPLPGFAVAYPQHAVTDKYRAFLEAEGFTLDSFVNKRFRELSLPGGYRKVVQMPGDVNCTFLRYDDPNAPLTLSDAERLQGKPEPTSKPGGASGALRVEFSLPASTYATMMLRELTKEDTTKQRQRELNKKDSAWIRGRAVAASAPASASASSAGTTSRSAPMDYLTDSEDEVDDDTGTGTGTPAPAAAAQAQEETTRGTL